jgi:hypothetical protein
LQRCAIRGWSGTGIGKGPDDTIDVVVWKDEEVGAPEVPPEFSKLMESEGLFASFRS